MFTFFKTSKPRLIDLINKEYVDIHSHILPGIDDGPKNIFESENLISNMLDIGFNSLIATPHTISGVWNNTPETIKDSFSKLKFSLKKNSKIKVASEYLLDNFFYENISKKNFLCLKDNYLLVELSYYQPPVNLFEILFELQVNGYIPVLAHPERYNYYFDDMSKIEKLKKAGCYLQLNLLSVVGYYGVNVLNMARKLINSNLIDFVGSDIHNTRQLKYFDKRVLLKNVKILEKVINLNQKFQN
tara:strand:- start:863 stop:1594 length:732 start_codon:yes stop_codon:yes gene_type:complete